MVEFVSYDGEYPNLCSGKLVLRINGVERVMPNHCLISGGTVWFDEGWGEHIGYGPWTADVPDDLMEYKDEIERVINENIPLGCCGGCI